MKNRRFILTRTMRLTLFSTTAITVVMFLLQLILLDMAPREIPQLAAVYALPVTALVSYVVSALVIDKAMNPIRLMSERIRETGKMNFTKPLIVYDEGEDIREYAAAYNEMTQQLHSYIERQKQFISDASHELATPITIINGHADLLLRRGLNPTMGDDITRFANSLTTIKTEAIHMNELIDSLLMLARSDSGKQEYRFARADMTKLLEDAAEEAQMLVSTAPGQTAPNQTPPVITTNIAPRLTAIVDENAVRRVLRILFSNAVKYGACENPRITLSAYASHGLTYITVRDNGPGIAAEHLPRIFERFYRADAARTQKKADGASANSSGLGLAIAREIIIAHGGEITAESTPGQGAEFKFFVKSS